MTPPEPLYTSGVVADRVQLPRWRLLYLIERGVIPGPTYTVPGRRLFTAADVRRITTVLAAQPGLRGGGDRPAGGDSDDGNDAFTP